MRAPHKARRSFIVVRCNHLCLFALYLSRTVTHCDDNEMSLKLFVEWRTIFGLCTNIGMLYIVQHVGLESCPFGYGLCPLNCCAQEQLNGPDKNIILISQQEKSRRFLMIPIDDTWISIAKTDAACKFYGFPLARLSYASSRPIHWTATTRSPHKQTHKGWRE